MDPKRYGLYAGMAASIIVVATITLSVLTRETPGDRIPVSSAPSNLGATDRPTPAPEKTGVHLYFADRDKPYLVAEERILLRSNDRRQYASAVVNELIAGPEQELGPTIPENVRLTALYIAPDGVAYVDMSSDIRTQHPGGSESELLTIYSIVNSLGLNVPGIESVKILVGGRDAMTLAGHIDLRFPLETNMLLVR